MKRTKIDLDHYVRKDQFSYFCSLDNPCVGLTVDVEVSSLVKACKEKNLSFYLAFMHAAALAADSVPEFRRRIIDGEIWEYDECATSHIEPLDNGSYCYCTLFHHMPLREYFHIAEEQRAAVKAKGTLEEDEDVDGMYFITCVPWLHYSALIQPTGKDSNARISWGKYEEDHKGRLMMPVTVLLHHGLVDGLHIARFYDALNSQIAEISREIEEER